MIKQDVLRALLEDDVMASRMPDVGLLTGYLRDGCRHGDPICLSFGETWSQVAPGLASRVNPEPRHSHGYQLSMYGLPTLRRTVRDYLVHDHGLEGVAEPGRDYEVAVSWAGTRSAMFDFGRLLLDIHRESDEETDSRVPVVIAAGPSWDYEGVYAPLGYRVRYHHLRAENAFQPSIDEVRALIADVAANPKERLALVVINAQHNPTAVNWDARFVTSLVQLARGEGAALLVDDAYFAVHDEGVTPTSALRIALHEMRDAGTLAGTPWLGVRSLGKQFHCNGWGLGAMVAHPAVLDLLVNRYRLHNSLMYGGIHQNAMADWLSSGESAEFLLARQREYAQKRNAIGAFLESRLGYPASKVHLGECTSYVMFAVPEAYAALADGVNRFKSDCFRDTGVLFAPAWPWPHSAGATLPLPYLRMFIGTREDEILTALTRLESAGLDYRAIPGGDSDDTSSAPPGPRSMSRGITWRDERSLAPRSEAG